MVICIKWDDGVKYAVYAIRYILCRDRAGLKGRLSLGEKAKHGGIGKVA